MQEELLINYAKLAVNIGINLQAGQEVNIYASTDAAYFVEYLVEECYKAKAKRVSVEWNNDRLTKLKYLNEDVEVLKEVKEWQVAKAKDQASTLPCKI